MYAEALLVSLLAHMAIPAFLFVLIVLYRGTRKLLRYRASGEARRCLREGEANRALYAADPALAIELGYTPPPAPATPEPVDSAVMGVARRDALYEQKLRRQQLYDEEDARWEEHRRRFARHVAAIRAQEEQRMKQVALTRLD